MSARTQVSRPVVTVALATALLLAAAILSITVRPAPADAGTAPTARTTPTVATIDDAARAKAGKKPTIVLVHGAFADASGWNDVSSILLAKGYDVHAWANPLRGLPTDAAYLRDHLSTIKGPIVLVGHSYGGAVITEASTGNKQVKALVYVAAYALDKGEDVAHANALGGGHSDIIESIVVRPYPGAPEGDGDAVVDPAKFRSIFAQDLPKSLTRVMAVSQRPSALSSLVLPAGKPGWKKIPSYYLVAKNDHLIPPQAQRVMAKRAGATTKQVASSHVLMMTHPELTARFVLRAAKR